MLSWELHIKILKHFLGSSIQERIQHNWWLFWTPPTDFVIKIKTQMLYMYALYSSFTILVNDEVQKNI